MSVSTRPATLSHLSIRGELVAGVFDLPGTLLASASAAESPLEKLGFGALARKWPREILNLGDVIGGLTALAPE